MSIYFQRNFQRGFGTFPLTGDGLRAALEAALDTGYRAIDTAQMYGNEAEVGEVLSAAALPRDELCVTTKIHPDNYPPGRFLASAEQSLADLRLDRVDVLLLHWPPTDGEIGPPLERLQQACDRGLCRFVGVSNFTAAMMREARRLIDAPIVTNQVEFHPLLNQQRLLAASVETGIPLSAYCSVARGAVFEQTELAAIAADYGKTVGQVTLRWILQKGVSVNTMSTRAANIRANYEVMDFTLSSVDLARIDALTQTGLRLVDRDRVPWAPEWD